MTNLINMNDKYVYRNGEPARVLCVDAGGKLPVVSLDKDGHVRCHKADGCYLHNGKQYKHDLIKVEPVIERYIVVRSVFGAVAGTCASLDNAKIGEDLNAEYIKASFQNGKLISVEIVE